MVSTVTFIGFGEAAQAFAGDEAWCQPANAYDIATATPAKAEAKWADYVRLGVTGCENLAGALARSSHILCLVTADAAIRAAQAAADHIPAGALYFDMNSVAPQTKRAAAGIINGAGGRYVDVAVMSPVYPARLAVPLLVCGPHAAAGAATLSDSGFTRVRVVPGAVGRASSIKMIRSVMIKGIEALTAECLLAAEQAGVIDEVLDSLGPDWAARANYNFDRMLVHGTRRAAEMGEVLKTLASLGVDPAMSQGTMNRQSALGSLGLTSPPLTLVDKLAAIGVSRKALCE